MRTFRYVPALLLLLLVALVPRGVGAQATVLVDLIAASPTVAAGGTLSLAGIVRPSSPTPVTLDVALDLTPGVVSSVSLTSTHSSCATATTCTVSASATDAAQVTISLVVRADTPPPSALVARLVVTGEAVGQSEPVVVQLVSGATATATAARTPPAASMTPTVVPSSSAARTPRATATERPLPSTTPDLRTLPDRCEPNDTPERACALPLDAISGPFTLVPEGDGDYYQLDLGPPSGLPTVVWVRAAADLDLVTTILVGDDQHQVGLIADRAISTTLSSDLTGPVLLHVQSRATDLTSGGIYRIEARRRTGLPPVPSAPPRGVVPPPDALENNWNAATAPIIGLDVAYDLTFACPVSGGCPGGDHDYLAVPVKQGQDYRMATFDLGPGVDTVLDLFWGDEMVPIISNDDAVPGRSFLSVLMWRAPADGTAIVRVAPRMGNQIPQLSETTAGTYRLAVTLVESAFGHELAARIAEQTLATPTPTMAPIGGTNATPVPAAAGGEAAPPPPAVAQPTAITSAIASGAAQIVHDTPVYLAPDSQSAQIATLHAGAAITLTGQTRNLWVQVASDAFLLPGWVQAQALQRITGATTTTAADADVPSTPTVGAGTSAAPRATAPPLPTAPPPLAFTALPALPLPAATVAPRLPVALTVVVQATTSTTSTGPTPTVSRAAGLDGVRVHLVDALGDVLVEGVTRDGGRLVLARDLPADTALWVQVPALGITVPVPTPLSAPFVILVPTYRPGAQP